MYREDLKRMSDVSRKKVDYLLHSPGGYFIYRPWQAFIWDSASV